MNFSLTKRILTISQSFEFAQKNVFMLFWDLETLNCYLAITTVITLYTDYCNQYYAATPINCMEGAWRGKSLDSLELKNQFSRPWNPWILKNILKTHEKLFFALNYSSLWKYIAAFFVSHYKIDKIFCYYYRYCFAWKVEYRWKSYRKISFD